MAACKNKCSSVYDIAGTSNDTSAASQALRLYDNCLVSFSVNDTTPAGQDCASNYYACDTAGLQPANACNSDYATCKNDCAVVLDACRSSGDESLIGLCDSLYNGCLDPVMQSNITNNATVEINATSTYILPAKTAFFNLTGAYSTIVSKISTSAAADISGRASALPYASTNGTLSSVRATAVSIPAAATSTPESSEPLVPSPTAASRAVSDNGSDSEDDDEKVCKT